VSDYEEFLELKRHIGGNHGFDPIYIPDAMFDVQKSLLEWSLLKGRSATFADCGLGKSLLELAWGDNVVRKTNGNVILLTPLAVTMQMKEEADKFGIEAHRSTDGKLRKGINIVNYERLHYFDPADFVGAICDESSVLKNFNGARKSLITSFMKKMKYRYLATATPSPNDFIELGTSSEALGYLGHMDMLNKFFKNDLNNSATGRFAGNTIKWRFKGHAERQFWRWVCSWARAVRKPSDLGFSDKGFELPPLIEREHKIDKEFIPEGMLFPMPACGLKEQRIENRQTLEDRCEKAASLLVDSGDYGVAWANLNDEGDLLERLIPDSVQVSGKDSDEAKEEKLTAFARGDIRVLVTKPKIGAWGLNYQHCNHMTSFPSHSFEQYYQMVRRFYRFGQEREVISDIITTDGNMDVMKNFKRKAAQAEIMFSNLAAEMNKEITLENRIEHTGKQEMPSWL